MVFSCSCSCLCCLSRFSTSSSAITESKYDSSLTTAELVSEVMLKAIADSFGASAATSSDAVVFTGKADKGDYQVRSMVHRAHLEPNPHSNVLTSYIQYILRATPPCPCPRGWV